jgi:Carboxypeptidase regulatory-like domain/PDZ domain
VHRRVLVAAIGVAIAIAALWWWRRSGEPTHAPQSVASTIHRMTRAAARHSSVSGRVTRRSDGGPIAGAVVSIGKPWTGAAEVPAVLATTDGDGRWELPELAPGTYVLAATARGFVPAIHNQFEIAPDRSPPDLDLALDAGGTPVTGTVRDVNGSAIAGARVIAHAASADDIGHVELVAVTGANGSYRLDLADGRYQLEAAHDDYMPASESIELVGAAKTVDLVLFPGATVRGRVIAGDTGDPVPDATVLAFGLRGFDVARSDADGKFALHHLGGGAISVRAYARDYATTDATMLVLGIGQRLDGVELVAERAYTVSGHVAIKGDPKAGLAGVYVLAAGLDNRLPPDRTGADGRFEIIGVPPGSHRIVAALDALMQDTTVEVIDHDVTDVVIELVARATLSGRVEPGAIADVTLEIDEDVSSARFDEMEMSRLVRATSDATGRFSLRNVPRGRFAIRALTKDGLAGTLAVTSTTADQTGLVVPLSPRASIAGRVVDTNGKPVTTGTVYAYLEDSPLYRLRGHYAAIAADGTFKLVGLDAGTYALSAPDGDPQAKLEVVVGTRAERTGVTLTVSALDGEIRGRVVDLDGKPAANAWITVNPGETPLAMARDRTVTDRDGKFVVGRLARGKYIVRAESASAYGMKTDVETGGTITLALAAPGALTLRVAKDGAPVTQYEVGCQGPAWLIDQVKSADGSHTFSRAAPGEYTCDVHTDRGTFTRKVSVAAGASAKLDVDILPERSASLTGVVVSIVTGKPVAGISVWARGSDGATTDANGRFVLEHAAAGDGELMLSPRDNITYRGFEKRAYTAKPDERVDLGTIRIAPPRTGEAGSYGFGVDGKDGGLRVTSVRPDGPAELAGIKVGDVIVTIDGVAVASIDLESAKRLVISGNVSIGQTATLGLARGATITVTAVKW